MANNRIFYACQSVIMNGPSGSNSNGNATWEAMQGIQSVGINTDYQLDPIYQLGHLDLYDNYEDVPEVEISLTKVLDGYSTIYGRSMGTGTLAYASAARCGVRLAIYPDNVTNAAGTPTYVLEMLPAYLSSITYNFPSDGNFTEEATLVANSKKWIAGAAANTAGPNSGAPNIISNATGIKRRQQWNDSASVLPTGLSGGLPIINPSLPGGGVTIQNFSISMNLGREELYKLGDRIPFTRYVNFPVEITTEIEIVSPSGDMASAAIDGAACENPKALMNHEIKAVLCDGMTIDLGTKNKLSTVNYTGGDTGGGNVSMTYTYTTYSHFTYTNPNGATATTDALDVGETEYSTDVSDFFK